MKTLRTRNQRGPKPGCHFPSSLDLHHLQGAPRSLQSHPGPAAPSDLASSASLDSLDQASGPCSPRCVPRLRLRLAGALPSQGSAVVGLGLTSTTGTSILLRPHPIGSSYRLLEITINKSKAQCAPTPLTFFSPRSCGAGNPSEECGSSIEALQQAHPSLLPHPHPSSHLVSSSSSSRGKNKRVVHSGNCRPLCGLSILALFKFRAVCSGPDKPSIRLLFRASKAHAEPGSPTARSAALALAKLCLQMTSAPGSSHLEAALRFGRWVPNPASSQHADKAALLHPLLCCVHISSTQLPLLKTREGAWLSFPARNRPIRSLSGKTRSPLFTPAVPKFNPLGGLSAKPDPWGPAKVRNLVQGSVTSSRREGGICQVDSS